jgi:hypothetical protein
LSLENRTRSNVNVLMGLVAVREGREREEEEKKRGRRKGG